MTHLRVHYKHCREICSAIKGMQLLKAKTYLENVLVQKDGIPFTKYTGGIGRHSVGKKYKVAGDKIAFPTKATKSFLDLLRNLESNVEVLQRTPIMMRTPADVKCLHRSRASMWMT